MLEFIFSEIHNRLLSNVPEINDVRIYNNQDAFPEKNLPVVCPSVFVQFGDIEYTTTSRQYQTAILPITIKVFHTSLNMNHLEVFQISECINQYLNGWGTWGYGLDERGETTDTNFDAMYIYNHTYVTGFKRCTIPPTYKIFFNLQNFYIFNHYFLCQNSEKPIPI